LKMQGRFVLSDDSHGVDQIGTNYGKALEFIKTTGIQEIYRFGKGSSEGKGRLNDTIMHRVSLDELESHDFWRSAR